MKNKILFIYRIIIRTIAMKTIGSYKNIPFIGFYSRFTKNTHIGFNCSFNGMIIRGNGIVKIGDNFHSGKDCVMINSYHKYDGGDSLPYDSRISIDKDITIEENVWIGDKVLILGGVNIGEGAIVQAGAVVVSDIPKYAIAGGNPAKVFKYRDKEHYKTLKQKFIVC